MNKNNATPSILQRVPKILAVTAASYGMCGPLQATRAHVRAQRTRSASGGMSPHERPARDRRAARH